MSVHQRIVDTRHGMSVDMWAGQMKRRMYEEEIHAKRLRAHGKTAGSPGLMIPGRTGQRCASSRLPAAFQPPERTPGHCSVAHRPPERYIDRSSHIGPDRMQETERPISRFRRSRQETRLPSQYERPMVPSRTPGRAPGSCFGYKSPGVIERERGWDRMGAVREMRNPCDHPGRNPCDYERNSHVRPERNPHERPGRNPHERPDRNPHEGCERNSHLRPDRNTHEGSGRNPHERVERNPHEGPERNSHLRLDRNPHEGSERNSHLRPDRNPHEGPGRNPHERVERNPHEGPERNAHFRPGRNPHEGSERNPYDFEKNPHVRERNPHEHLERNPNDRETNPRDRARNPVLDRGSPSAQQMFKVLPNKYLPYRSSQGTGRKVDDSQYQSAHDEKYSTIGRKLEHDRTRDIQKRCEPASHMITGRINVQKGSPLPNRNSGVSVGGAEKLVANVGTKTKSVREKTSIALAAGQQESMSVVRQHASKVTVEDNLPGVDPTHVHAIKNPPGNKLSGADPMHRLPVKPPGKNPPVGKKMHEKNPHENNPIGVNPPGEMPSDGVQTKIHTGGDVARPQQRAIPVHNVHQMELDILRRSMLPLDGFVRYGARPEAFWSARGKVLQVIFELGHQFRVQQRTMHQAIQLADRYLMKQEVIEGVHMLFSFVVSMLIAIKFSESRVSHPNACEFLRYASKGICPSISCPEKLLLSIERKILRHLNFRICPPTAINFLQMYLNGLGVSMRSKLAHLCNLYVDFTMMTCQTIQWSPEKCAATSLLAALEQIVLKSISDGHRYWRTELQPLTDLAYEEVYQMTRYMQERIQAWAFSVLARKYSRKEKLMVSEIVWPGKNGMFAMTSAPTALTALPRTGPTPALSFLRGV